MRALIADDDRVTTAVLQNTLERLGMEVVVAHDGTQAWELLRFGKGPALAIIDWMMPGIDGPEICRLIRRDTRLTHMYVILLTGRDSRVDMVTGLNAGADDYIVKPFDPEELRARVQVGIRVLTLQERLADRIGELQTARDELAHAASTDALTGLASRRRWLEAAAAEFSRRRRYNRPFALLVVDLDYFKRVNDTFGHHVGDDVLRRFSEVLRLNCRGSDLVGRLGGEEFAVLLPETDAHAAREVARRIVEGCRGITVPGDGEPMTCSCSVGVTEATDGDNTIDEILRRADQAMYDAKREGRDRWNCSVGPSAPPPGKVTPFRPQAVPFRPSAETTDKS